MNHRNPKALAHICITALKDGMSCDNALDCLIFADVINSDKLRRQARSFIVANKSHYAMKASWKRLDLDVTKFCLEIILITHPLKLFVTEATCPNLDRLCKEARSTLCEDAVSFNTYEDIYLQMVEIGLVWQNVLSIQKDLVQRNCLQKFRDLCGYTYDSEISRIPLNFYFLIIRIYF